MYVNLSTVRYIGLNQFETSNNVNQFDGRHIEYNIKPKNLEDSVCICWCVVC